MEKKNADKRFRSRPLAAKQLRETALEPNFDF
jgi:hypothetical protein